MGFDNAVKIIDIGSNRERRLDRAGLGVAPSVVGDALSIGQVFQEPTKGRLAIHAAVNEDHGSAPVAPVNDDRILDTGRTGSASDVGSVGHT